MFTNVDCVNSSCRSAVHMFLYILTDLCCNVHGIWTNRYACVLFPLQLLYSNMGINFEHHNFQSFGSCYSVVIFRFEYHLRVLQNQFQYVHSLNAYILIESIALSTCNLTRLFVELKTYVLSLSHLI